MGELPFGIFSGIAHFRFNALLLVFAERLKPKNHFTLEKIFSASDFQIRNLRICGFKQRLWKVNDLQTRKKHDVLKVPTES